MGVPGKARSREMVSIGNNHTSASSCDVFLLQRGRENAPGIGPSFLHGKFAVSTQDRNLQSPREECLGDWMLSAGMG